MHWYINNFQHNIYQAHLLSYVPFKDLDPCNGIIGSRNEHCLIVWNRTETLGTTCQCLSLSWQALKSHQEFEWALGSFCYFFFMTVFITLGREFIFSKKWLIIHKLIQWMQSLMNKTKCTYISNHWLPVICEVDVIFLMKSNSYVNKLWLILGKMKHFMR